MLNQNQRQKLLTKYIYIHQKNLLSTINTDKIHGRQFIECYRKSERFIYESTNYAADEVYQIEAMLFPQFTHTKQKFTKYMDKINQKEMFKSMPNAVNHRI